MSGDCNVCINGKLPSYSPTCVECGLSRKNFKPMTNYDLLISKTPEEMAVWIAENTGCDDWCMHDRNGECSKKPENWCCINTWYDWLKSPVEVDK